MKLTFTIFILFFSYALFGQFNPFKPDISRALFHDRLDEAQIAILGADGNKDKKLEVLPQAEVNDQLTYLLTTKIDHFQQITDTHEKMNHQQKLMLIRGMTELLDQFRKEIYQKRIGWNELPVLLTAFFDASDRFSENQPLAPVIAPLSLKESAYIVENFAFQYAPDALALKELLILKMSVEDPAKVLPYLSRNPNYKFTDSLIGVLARKRPEDLISYSQARSTPLGQKIVAHPDPLVKWIVSLGHDRNGQLLLPFLDKLSREQLTREQVIEATKDEHKYYRLLVETQVEYAGRMRNGDTPVVRKGLNDMLHRKSLETYVNVINGLHDYGAPVRFAKIQNLRPEELYYLAVMNEIEIYTSSYMYVFNRIFSLMPNSTSDSLFRLVNYDKFKKFITMAAAFNNLDRFLGQMDKQEATTIMTNFVNDLDGGENMEDIEDAVDVANAYASIKDTAYRKLMLDRIKENEKQAILANNKKGKVIYQLERMIMESNDHQLAGTENDFNISDSLGIPPVYSVSNKNLQDEKGRIIMQMFFYGDAGGRGTFNHLLRLYGDRSKWSVESTPQWVKFTSVKTPVPVILFANRALTEDDDQDEKAQEALIAHMTENGFAPSITVHRGHSYFLPYTIKKMLPSKVVILGSCGAYHSLNDILQTSPDAYIIGSKQVGYGEINVQLFTYLNDQLKMGKDISWPGMMQDVSNRLRAAMQRDYEDYVFPHQNLGALMIKAYKTAMATEPEFVGSMP